MPSVTRNAMSITVKAGYLTHVSASFIGSVSGGPSFHINRAVARALFTHGSTIAKIPFERYGDAVTRGQALHNFDLAHAAIVILRARLNGAFGDVRTIQDKNFVGSIAVADCLLGHGEGLFRNFACQRTLYEQTGFKPA